MACGLCVRRGGVRLICFLCFSVSLAVSLRRTYVTYVQSRCAYVECGTKRQWPPATQKIVLAIGEVILHASMRTCGHPLTNTHYFNAPPELGAPAASSLDQPIGGELKERE